MAFGESFEKQSAAQAKNNERQWRQEAKPPVDQYREVCKELKDIDDKINEVTRELGPGALLRGVELNKKNILRFLELQEKKQKLEVDYQLSEKDLEDESVDLGATLQ